MTGSVGSTCDGVRWLLARGATVGQRDRHGVTPLERAQYAGLREVASLLREHGARAPRRRDLSAARGYECPGGSHASLCLKLDAGPAADEVARVTGGTVVRDVYRTRQKAGRGAALVVQLRGHAWSHVPPVVRSPGGAGEMRRLRRAVLRLR